MIGLLIFVIIFIFIYFKLTCGDYKTLIFFLKALLSYVCKIKYNFTDFPIPAKILNVIEKIIIRIQNMEQKNFKFVDFGCGTGTVLLKIQKLFNKIDGIEIDKKIANKTKKDLFKYTNINIKNMDMQFYDYEMTNTILYFYEPLFVLENIKASNIYDNVFRNIDNTFKSTNFIFYILYVTDVSKLSNKNILSYLFEKYNFLLVKKTTQCLRDIYIYKYNN